MTFRWFLVCNVCGGESEPMSSAEIAAPLPDGWAHYRPEYNQHLCPSCSRVIGGAKAVKSNRHRRGRRMTW